MNASGRTEQDELLWIQLADLLSQNAIVYLANSLLCPDRLKSSKTLAYLLRHVFKKYSNQELLQVPGAGLQFAVVRPSDAGDSCSTVDLQDTVSI